MKFSHWIGRTLIRIYPAGWRREYGAELAHVLAQRPLTLMALGDVLWNGVRQRIRDTEPAILMGLTAMLVVSAGVIANIANLTAARGVFGGVLRDSSMTLPTITVTAFETNLYAVALMLCGYWTHLRHGGRASASGMAAVRLGALAGVPVMLAGLLMLVGAVHLRVAGPADALLNSGSPWTYTYFTPKPHAPSWLAVSSAPLLRLPQAWIYGWIGGQLARVIARRRAMNALTP